MKKYLKSFATGEALRQFIKVAMIGVVNTVTFFILFNLLWSGEPAPVFWPIAIAFALATLVSYVMNRRWTFQLTEGHVVFRETVSFFVVNVVAWAFTEGTVKLTEVWFGPLSRMKANVALVIASGLILLPKFASYRDVVFKKALAGRDAAKLPKDPSVVGE